MSATASHLIQFVGTTPYQFLFTKCTTAYFLFPINKQQLMSYISGTLGDSLLLSDATASGYVSGVRLCTRFQFGKVIVYGDCVTDS